MKLSTISKLAAVAALCLAGYVDAHAQTNANNGASVGTNSAPTGTCTGLSNGDCSFAYEVAVAEGFHGSKSDWSESLRAHDGLPARKDYSLAYDQCVDDKTLPAEISVCMETYTKACAADNGFCAFAIGPGGLDPSVAVAAYKKRLARHAATGGASVAVVASYQKQLARHASTAARLIEDNAEILSTSCLVEVETLQRSLRNAYSSTGGQLPLYEQSFNRHSPEFRGYVAALVDQSRKTSAQIESMVTYNCQDPNATAATVFFKGAMAGPVDAAWFQSWDTFLEGRE